MKRQRTLSGIRAVLDYKNLNVFGDIVGNFQGQNVPSVEDFSIYLQSHDSCDNLKSLANQQSGVIRSQSSKSLESVANEKAKKGGRRTKKRSADDDVNSEENLSTISEPTVQAQAPIQVQVQSSGVIGSIGQFFQRFIQKYPRGTAIYDRFIKLSKAYEGKSVDEKTFYSSMKEMLASDQSELLMEFVDLIRPDDANMDNLTFESPANNEDFPFNIERKRNKTVEYHQMMKQPQVVAPPQVATVVSNQGATPGSALSSADVNDVVKTAINDKAKEFLLQAKSSMDPHTYVSFLDIMVELRSLYKSNEIEEAIEKLDIAKGILTRVNPQLRVEFDRYFPIVNANGAKHNLEHHTFEQSQRQYREWQQAQVARKQMLQEECTPPSPVKDIDNGKGSSKDWYTDISMTKIDPAQQKKDRMKLSAYEKEQIQNAKRVAKENASVKQASRSGSSAEANVKEDLLDALSTSKSNRKRGPAATSRSAPRGMSKTNARGGGQGGNTSGRNIGKGVQRNTKGPTMSQPNSLSDNKSSNSIHPQSRPQSHMSQNMMPGLGSYQQGDYQNFNDFVQYMHQQQNQQQHVGQLSDLATMSGDPSGAGGNGYNSSGNAGNGVIPPYPFPSASMSVLPPHPSMMNSFHMPTSGSGAGSHNSQPQLQHLHNHSQQGQPHHLNQRQYSSYGPSVGGSYQPQQHQHLQQQQQIQSETEHQQPHNVNYTPAFQSQQYGNFSSSGMLPSSHISTGSPPSQVSTVLPPPPQGSTMGMQSSLLPPYNSVPPSLLPPHSTLSSQSQAQAPFIPQSSPKSSFDQHNATQDVSSQPIPLSLPMSGQDTSMSNSVPVTVSSISPQAQVPNANGTDNNMGTISH